MADKKEKVAELKQLFADSSAIYLTEYRGLTVTELKTLRRSMANDATYVVAKNTLLTIAAKEAGVTAFDGQLAGPIAPPPVVDSLDFGDSRFDVPNKSKVKKDLRAKHRPNKLYAAKDRRSRSR